MTPPGRRFPFVNPPGVIGPSVKMPFLAVTLLGTTSVQVDALIDTGSMLNVLPHSLGLQLGGQWKQCPSLGGLAGSLSHVQCLAFHADVIVGQFPAVTLALAWAESDSVRTIFGSIDFLEKFDVCFFRSRGEFEVRPKV